MTRAPAVLFFLLAAELILGGSGRLMEFFGLGIRTWLLIVFLTVWSISVFRAKNFSVLQIPYGMTMILGALALSVAIGTLNGFLRGHDARAIIQDAIPFFYFLLLFPARQFLTPDRFPAYKRLIQAHLILAAAISAVTLFLFSAGFAVLHGPYYRWFRDVLAGKITDLGTGFFRIALPEHLLLVPILLFFIASIIRGEKTASGSWGWVALGFVPLVTDLSRTYALAFLLALPFLFVHQLRWRWVIASGGSIFLALALFFGIHFLASRGESIGFELIAGRAASIAAPETELSATTRKILLGPIWKQIRQHPILGNGLGATVTFPHPVSGAPTITRHFDWGYLEIWSELGLSGLFSYLSLLAYLLFHARGSSRAGIVAIGAMNGTAPILFHVFGICLLVFFLSQIKSPRGDSGGSVASSSS